MDSVTSLATSKVATSEAKPLDCPHCEHGVDTYYRRDCRKCDGTGHERCDHYKHDPKSYPAITTSLTDRGIKLCLLCAADDHVYMREWFESIGLDAATIERWVALLPTLDDDVVDSMIAMSHDEYIATMRRLLDGADAAKAQRIADEKRLAALELL